MSARAPAFPSGEGPGRDMPSRPRKGPAMQGLLRAAVVITLALGPPLAERSGAAPPTKEEAPPPVLAGAEYPHKAVKRTEIGTGPRSYWLFEPAEPAPASAPVVVFLHGWIAVNPGAYGAWIDHLTRRGSIVIFPRYHADWQTRPSEFLPNAAAAVRDGLDVLRVAPGHVRPDRSRFALVGHSAGGNLAALLAAVAEEQGLPSPKAVVAIMPGEVKPLREPSLARIPATCQLAVVAADSDWVVGDVRARQIFAESTSVPPSHKQYVLYRTDRHGSPPLVANHTAPTATLAAFDTGEGPLRSFQMAKGEVNALDRFGLWRVADVTLEAGFTGRTLVEASGHGAVFRDPRALERRGGRPASGRRRRPRGDPPRRDAPRPAPGPLALAAPRARRGALNLAA